MNASSSRARCRAAAAPVATEHAEQAALIAWADAARCRYMLTPDLSALDMLFSIPNAGGFSGGFRVNVVRVSRLRREGVKAGVPDLMLAVPIGKTAGLFVEMKRTDGGRGASKEQRGWIANLARVGYRAEVCAGADQAIELIRSYLQPLGNRLCRPNA